MLSEFDLIKEYFQRPTTRSAPRSASATIAR
jgi:hypothetical protein